MLIQAYTKYNVVSVCFQRSFLPISLLGGSRTPAAAKLSLSPAFCNYKIKLNCFSGHFVLVGLVNC